MSAKEITKVPPMPPRAEDAHKGEVGRLLIVAGQFGDVAMVGAAALCANAALRTGAGLVQVATTYHAIAPLSALVQCATFRTYDGPSVKISLMATNFKANAVAVGPGLGETVGGYQISDLLKNYKGAVVLDADALNQLATLEGWSAPEGAGVVITPHPGEMARLCKGLKIAFDKDKRTEMATRVAELTNTTVVLKGAGTVVADKDHVYVNATGNSGMASGGMGDVLTGVIAALLGQGMPPLDAAILGVYCHGLAGNMAAEEITPYGMTATDVIDFLPAAYAVHMEEGG